MATLTKIALVITFALLSAITYAQNYTGRVIDAKSGKPVPYATVITGPHSGTITNEEGIFSLEIDKIRHAQDSIYISSMGYEKVGLIATPETETTIALTSKPFELKKVYLTNENLSPEEIIDRVKLNLSDNYAVDMTRKKIFFRQSDLSKVNKFDIEFKESTIEELDKELIDSVARLIPREHPYYRETVADLYGDYSTYKLHIDKAAELYDKNKDISMDAMGDKLERIFKENVKPDSYLKIKSGIFGTKVQLDSLENAEEGISDDTETITVKVEDENKPHYGFQWHIRNRIYDLYEELFFKEDTKLDFLEKSNRYRFEQRGYTFIDDSPVYIIDFTPKGKKDFQGTLFVNTQDFAIMRLDFENVRPLRRFGLLGITYRHNVFRGKMLFAKNPNGGYGPRYLELEDGELTGIDRPLKVIEKNKNVKGRRKQNELSLHFDVLISELSKYEMVVFESEAIDAGIYQGATENPKVEASYLSAYDPSFWEGYAIMEPNAAIQAFRVVEE